MQSHGDELAPLTPKALAAALGISGPYASQILSGARPLDLDKAVKIFQATGHRLGPIADATTAEIAVLERFAGAA